jgi:bacteriorhodopsin
MSLYLDSSNSSYSDNNGNINYGNNKQINMKASTEENKQSVNDNIITQTQNTQNTQKSKNTKNTDVTKDGKLDGVKTSFTLTYILLLTTSLVTFIEAIRTQNPLVRHIFNLETCISLVGGYFYSIFVGMIDDYKKRNVNFDWDAITKIRYLDWSITTPMMLLSLCLVLAKESRKIIHLTTILLIIFLNYLMLYVGYLGEIKYLSRTFACIGGFIPFVIMFYIIFKNYTVIDKGFSKYYLFVIYIVTWSFYGVVYLLGDEYKNIAMNILDCFSKCVVGLLLWGYYTNIIPRV